MQGEVRKYAGNPILVADKPWEKYVTSSIKGVQLEGQAVLYDEEEKLFKMWYILQGLWISQGRAALPLRNEQVNGRVNANGTFEHKTDPESFARARRALAKALDSWPMPDEE